MNCLYPILDDCYIVKINLKQKQCCYFSCRRIILQSISSNNMFQMHFMCSRYFLDICDMKLDLVFLIDSSGSVLPNEYQMMKDFIKTVVQYNGLSRNGIHAGIVLFSSTAKVAIKLNDFFETRSFISAVQSLEHHRSARLIDKGLYVAYSQLLTKDFGARMEVPKVMLILSHGVQTKTKNYIDLRVASMPLKESGVLMTAIGIGRHTDREELVTITGNTESVYTVRNFKLLLQPRITENFDFKCNLRK